MPREEAFEKRVGQLYGGMQSRFRARYWRSGRLKGRLRVAAREIPFTRDRFKQWFLEQLGDDPNGCKQCAYCTRFVTAIDASVDHVEPLKQGGSLDLDNLTLCCIQCNKYKGSLSLLAFNALKEWLHSEIGRVLTVADAAEIEQRLRAPISYHKMMRDRDKHKKAAQEKDEDF